MGKLSKQVFRQYVEFECDRQLFWLVGREDRRWMTKPEAPIPRDERRARPEMAAALGKAYEQRVYRFLLRLKGTAADLDPRGDVVESSLDADLMEELGEDQAAGERPATFALLEHQWETPASFLRHVFGSPVGWPLISMLNIFSSCSSVAPTLFAHCSMVAFTFEATPTSECSITM